MSVFRTEIRDRVDQIRQVNQELEKLELMLWQMNNLYADDDLDSFRRQRMDQARISELQAQQDRLKATRRELATKVNTLLERQALIDTAALTDYDLAMESER